jgi:hypothetical protein
MRFCYTLFAKCALGRRSHGVAKSIAKSERYIWEQLVTGIHLRFVPN